MSTSLAAVFDGELNRLSLRHIPTPQPGPGELLVRVLGCTLCGSDLHSIAGRRKVPVPTILGHEIVGEIVATGVNAPTCDYVGKSLALGDRVTWALVASCGECFYCQRGLPQKCAHGVKYGHEAFRPGRELVGGLAEHCLLVPGTAVLRVADCLSLEEVCPASCATATIAAACAAAGDLRDRSVVVLGLGMLGLTAAAMAHARGAVMVVGVDVHAERRAQAGAFGAQQAVAPEQLAEVVAQATAGHGADVILELSGANAALEAALPAVRLGGTIVLVGSVFPGPAFPWPLEQIVRRNLSIRGVHNYLPGDLATALEFLEQSRGKYPFAGLASHWVPLAEVERGLELAHQAGNFRVGVRP